MPPDTAWRSYLSARQTALGSCGDPAAAADSIGRAEARLHAYLRMEPEQAGTHARRSFLYSADAAFHDQLLASGSADLLRTIVERTSADGVPLAPNRACGGLAVTLHYGPATSILPLWLAMASQMGTIRQFAVIQNSQRNPNVMLSADRHAALLRSGFPFADLDIARLGEVAALRRARSILREGGIVLIFADGQLPRPGAKRTVTCRLGAGALALPQGAQWLARSADVPLLPLLLRPERDAYRLSLLNTCAPGRA